MTIPNYVGQVIITLQGAGYEAYAVGGCVRDTLLGRRPSDWDVAASAKPEEVMGLFKSAIPTGIRHGTVTVRASGRKVEVTTFRSDGLYSDGRRPDSVEFVGGLNEDLARRDFTMNAMAAGLDGSLIDPFGGEDDIRRRIIRCVGLPEERFREDALRMLRAYRFAAKLDFSLDASLLEGIASCREGAEKLSAERIRDEIEKILLSPKPEILEQAVHSGLLSHRLERDEIRLNGAAVSRLPKNPMERWAVFVFLLYKAGALPAAGPEESAAAFLRNLRLDGKTVSAASKGAGLAVKGLPSAAADWKRLLSVHGAAAVCCAASCAAADGRASCRRELGRILKSGDCFTLKNLAVNGGLISERFGLPQGEELGKLLNHLLEHVIDNPRDNEEAVLMEIAALDLSII